MLQVTSRKAQRENLQQIEELFQAIDIREKGLTQIYDYVLRHNMIEDLQAVTEKLDLTIKRGYKIISVLKDLALVSIYDRPMKVALQDPIEAWEKLISRKIDEIREETQLRVNNIEQSLRKFKTLLTASYDIQSQSQPAPVEFIRHDEFEFVFYPFIGARELCMARGFYYDNPGLRTLLEEYHEGELQKQDDLEDLLEKINELHVKLLISEDVLKQVPAVLESTFGSHKPELAWHFKDLEVRVSDKPFSNFIIKEDVLIQPSFDPTMAQNGSFLSQQEETLQVFRDKFQKLFKEATPLEEYVKANAIDLDEDLWELFCII